MVPVPFLNDRTPDILALPLTSNFAVGLNPAPRPSPNEPFPVSTSWVIPD